MNLPGYFLADLPREAILSAALITEACQSLKHNRERYLAERSTQCMTGILSELAQDWLKHDYPFRKMALEFGPTETGFSRPILTAGLDAFFQRLTQDAFQTLLLQELGHLRRFDHWEGNPLEQKADRASWVRGPELLAHIAGGVLPNPTLTNIILGLLARSAQFVKCASGAAFIPRLFAHSLYDAEPKLGACLEIAEWTGGKSHLESALFDEADCLTATGSDETLAAIRQRLPAKVRLLGYGHRVSFGYIAHEVLSGFNAKNIAASAADDIVAWDQLGCLSPHVLYLEQGGGLSAEQFAELLAVTLENREELEPRGKLSTEQSALIAHRRAFYEVRAVHSRETRQWCSRGSTAWTVVYEVDARFQLSCLNRFIYVKGVTDLAEALQNADAVRGKVSTVGLAATEEKARELAAQLAKWGVTRICPLGQMQHPPLTWRHDGRPSLGDLVTWSDWEQ